jgi:hypothetical protein
VRPNIPGDFNPTHSNTELPNILRELTQEDAMAVLLKAQLDALKDHKEGPRCQLAWRPLALGLIS